MALSLTEQRSVSWPPLSDDARHAAALAELLRQGRADEANERFRALYPPPPYAEEVRYWETLSHNALVSGMVRLFLGNAADAKGLLEQAVKWYPRNFYARSVLADLSADRPEAAEARAEIRAFKGWEGAEDLLVLGDSHSYYLFIGVARARVRWLKGVTMHRVGRDGVASLGVGAEELPENGYAVFCFGEIDARAHLLRKAQEQGAPPSVLIERLVGRYTAAIGDFIRGRPDVQVIVCGVVPPIDGPVDPALPRFGSLAERIHIFAALNAALKAAAHANGFLYLDVHELFRDPSGALEPRYWDGLCHVAPEHYPITSRALEALIGSRGAPAGAS